ncbi:MAG: hypothetical protein ACR2PG_05565 [Hyphomicrobiaceae bacterium]
MTDAFGVRLGFAVDLSTTLAMSGVEGTSTRPWHSEPEYQEFIRLRDGSETEFELILVDGCDG